MKIREEQDEEFQKSLLNDRKVNIYAIMLKCNKFCFVCQRQNGNDINCTSIHRSDC